MAENKKKMTDQDISNQETLNQDKGQLSSVSVEDLLQEVAQEAAVPELDTKRLEQQINRRITAIVRRFLLVLTVCIAALLCVLHPVMKLVTYNYKAKDKVIVDVATRESQLERYLDAYASVFMPYREIFDVEVKDRGFGVHTLDLQMADHQDKLIIGSHENLVRFLAFDKWWNRQMDDSGRFVFVFGRFAGDSSREPETMVPQLEELPDSAVIFCNVTLKEALLPEMLWRDGIKIHWFRVDQRLNDLDAGIRVYQQTNIDPQQKFRTEMTGAELRDEFIKELDILLQDSFLLEPLTIPFSDRGEDMMASGGGGSVGYTRGVEQIRELRNYAAELEAVKTREICLSGKKADVIAFIQEMNVRGVHVENVWMSQWTK